MRGGLSTIQQTLTAEAASVLNQSIAEARRRNHGQTTPLHVAATLLASPSGFLRQACIRSHPNSSHPLQCRALELCFSVALERLPTAHNASPGTEPPISNALMAALKRAQAHQRRGCPEQQQQPLLAVKVELEQLIVSILDDPSVSRVMREASFSSPAVKATIEQSLNSTAGNVNPGPLTTGFRPNLSPIPIPMSIPNRNLYLNPKLQQGASGAQGQQRSDEVKRVIDIFMRTEKKNPILVGDTEPEAVMKELLRRIEKGELSESPLKNVEVIKIDEFVSDKMQLPNKINELGRLIESRIGDGNGSGGVILSLGNLKWLMEQPASLGVPNQLVVSEVGRAAVAEMGKLLGMFGEGGSAAGAGKVWLIGTATCETYLRCQFYYPSMENDWDLQAVPIASRSPVPGMFSRPSSGGNFGSSSVFINPLKTPPTAASPLTRRVTENSDPARKLGFCSQCSQNYEQELAKLVAEESETSYSEVTSEAAKSPLPLWLQNAKVGNGNVETATDQSQGKERELLYKQKSQELQKKWSETCLRLHPNYQYNLSCDRTAPTSLSMTGLYNPKLRMCQPSQAKLQPTTSIEESLQLNSNQLAMEPLDCTRTSPGSAVRTDLILGRTGVSETTTSTQEEHVKDFLGCSSLPPQDKSIFDCFKFANAFDTDSFKKLLNGLMEKAWWQPEAASSITTTVTRCRLGNVKTHGTGSRGDIWLLFTGPDRVGKKKMASVLAEHVCGTSPIMVRIGSQRDDKESDTDLRGKTALDRIVEAVRKNPFSVIMLEDIDEADVVIRRSIKRAMERGRLVDSHGREISLGNVIFILAGNWSTIKNSGNGNLHDEKKLACMERGGWQLRLTIREKSGKRRANWLNDEDRPPRHRKEMGSGLPFDLNLAADTEDNGTNGSNNTSDLTIHHKDEPCHENRRLAITSLPLELVSSVDDTIVFKPVDYNAIRCEINKTISNKFSSIIEDSISVEVDNDALEKILGGVWHGDNSLTEWTKKVLDPSFQQLKARLPASMVASWGETMAVRLEMITDPDDGNERDWLPRKITVMVD